jgi:hypothetical protein
MGNRVGDLVIEDELVQGIDGDLDVVADIGGAAAGGHAAAVGAGEGDLGLAAALELLLQFLGPGPLALHLFDLLAEFFCGELLVW